MSKFNVYLNSHFSSGGCQLIARARDENRNRDVCLYRVPGHWDVVGVSDGVDAWIAPTSAGPFFKTATGDVTKIMRALEAGEPLPPVPERPTPRVERRKVLDDAFAPNRRTVVAAAPAATGRRHVVL